MHYIAKKVRFLNDVVVELTYQDGKVIQYEQVCLCELGKEPVQGDFKMLGGKVVWGMAQRYTIHCHIELTISCITTG